MRRYIFGISLIATLLILGTLPTYVYGSVYGGGTYGSCQYSSCGITLSSSTDVDIDVTPVGGSTTCTVASDSVAVTASSSTGYTVTVGDTDTSNELTTGAVSNTIAAVGGSAANPAPLTANSWGYRVDDVASFGSGPTTAITNASVPSLQFGAIPPSDQTAGLVATSAVASPTPTTTKVWYGTCVDVNTPTAAYSDDIVYTAVIN